MENFKFSFMYPCHSQMAGIAATIIFYAKVPEWQWHYDMALDSLYLMATARFCLYVFFHCAFATPVHSPLFDLVFPYLAIPIHLTHPPAPAPPPSQLVQQVPSKSDPSEEMDTSSSSSKLLMTVMRLPTLAWQMDSSPRSLCSGVA